MAATTQQAKKFLQTVIRPTLQAIDLWSSAAEELLLGTALQESDLIYRRQLRGGPARGLFQMEPATHDDIWSNFLRHQPKQAKAVRALLSTPGADRIAELELNDNYACAMARMHYRRVPEALPAAGDVQEMARYWKQYYNTMAGAGRPADYIKKWNRVMNNNDLFKLHLERIETIYAFITTDAQGHEGIPAIRADNLALPLVGADLARINSLRMHAQDVADFTGQPVTLCRFVQREVIEVMHPRRKETTQNGQ